MFDLDPEIPTSKAIPAHSETIISTIITSDAFKAELGVRLDEDKIVIQEAVDSFNSVTEWEDDIIPYATEQGGPDYSRALRFRTGEDKNGDRWTGQHVVNRDGKDVISFGRYTQDKENAFNNRFRQHIEVVYDEAAISISDEPLGQEPRSWKLTY